MDKLVGISIENFRSIKALELPLRPMRVLMGENGGGKSSILECFEIFRRASEPRFFDQLDRLHGGTANLQRQGTTAVHLRARILLDKDEFVYSVSFGGQFGYSTRPQVESLGISGGPPIFRVVQGNHPGHPGNETILSTGLVNHEAVQRVRQVLSNIDVQLGFDVNALWKQRERNINTQGTGMREPAQLRGGRRLEGGGSNLASVIHSLRNDQGREEWERTLRIIKLGLGDHLEDVAVSVMDTGYAALTLRYRDGRRVSAQGLSDGQLAFLCFVAAARASAEKSVLLIDEPELHLHPGLLVRVFDLLQETSDRVPVVLATHAGALLDAVESPEEDVSVVSLRDGETHVEQLSSEFLHRWKLPLSQLRAEMGDRALVVAP